jgi:GNAT superfamily N-acetyltransferase
VPWRAARPADGPAIAELRVDVLRESLERVGRFDPARARAHFLGSSAPESTRVLDGPEGTWIEHFHLARDLQGTGRGGALLADVTAAADGTGTTLLLDVLVGSDARRPCERHGFVEDHTDGVDVIVVRPAR